MDAHQPSDHRCDRDRLRAAPGGLSALGYDLRWHLHEQQALQDYEREHMVTDRPERVERVPVRRGYCHRPQPDLADMLSQYHPALLAKLPVHDVRERFGPRDGHPPKHRLRADVAGDQRRRAGTSGRRQPRRSPSDQLEHRLRRVGPRHLPGHVQWVNVELVFVHERVPANGLGQGPGVRAGGRVVAGVHVRTERLGGQGVQPAEPRCERM